MNFLKTLIKISLFLVLAGGYFCQLISAQETRVPQPSLPGVQSFNSNLGVQEIIEVGVPIGQEKKESKFVEPTNPKPRGSTTPKPPVVEGFQNIADVPVIPAQTRDRPYAVEPPVQKVSKGSGESLFSTVYLSAQAGVRAYVTNNVLRQKSSLAEDSGVLESNIGLGFSLKEREVTEYITMIPRIDFFMQWADYQERAELLDYRFGLAKGTFTFGLPKNWTFSASLDFNSLHNSASGRRTFDSFSPSVSLQKAFPLPDESTILFDVMLRKSSMNATTEFPAAGIFSDSGNNNQTSFNLSYIKQFGERGQWSLIPRASIFLTKYTESPYDGRLDYMSTLGASLIYQWTDWFGIQSFLTRTKMRSDEIDDFRNLDAGMALSSSFQF